MKIRAGYFAVNKCLRTFAIAAKGTSLAADVGISRTILSRFRQGKCDLNLQDCAVLAVPAGYRLCLIPEDLLEELRAREVTGGDRSHGSTAEVVRPGGPTELDKAGPVSSRDLSGKERSSAD
ncbi:hypothetical protein [Rhodospirillum sp. A1_3_36]|uniref:hypothetical protein n=1 Tax=Rhodospirillum sp. A1_3_36 TaxID=3391666 RepID=UPI0039A65D74